MGPFRDRRGITIASCLFKNTSDFFQIVIALFKPELDQANKMVKILRVLQYILAFLHCLSGAFHGLPGAFHGLPDFPDLIDGGGQTNHADNRTYACNYV